jgi:hypothetical protein
MFELYDLPERINTLLIVKTSTDTRPLFTFHNDFMLHKHQSMIRIVLLGKLADINHSEMVLDMKSIKIDNVCLMSEGKLAIHL